MRLVAEGKIIVKNDFLGLSQEMLASIWEEKARPAKEQIRNLSEKIANLEKVNLKLKNETGESLKKCLEEIIT